MNYVLPDELGRLRDWMRSRGADVRSIKSERQAAFLAQQLAGTRFKFPPKGASCFPLMQQIQAQIASPGTRSQKPAVSRPTKSDNPNRPLESDTSTGLVIYADGCCEPNPGPGGWGFVVYRDRVEIHAECGGEAVTTNNQQEITAATRALEWFAERGIVEPVRLLTDSRYTVDGANIWRHGWKAKGWRRKGGAAKASNQAIANLDLWKALDAALIAVPIRLEWVKGHAGIAGNERADELADQGMREAIEVAPDLIAQQLAYVVA